MSNLRLVDDTQGRVKEVLINYCPEGFDFTSRLIDALPDATFYIAYGPTLEDLESKLMGFGDVKNFGTDTLERLSYVTKLDLKFLRLLQVGPSQVFEIINAYEEEIGRGNKETIAFFGGPKNVGEQIDMLEKVYASYLQDEKLREFIHTLLYYTASKYYGGSLERLKKLKEKSPGRVNLVSCGKMVTAFSRDRILAGKDGNGKVLIQGNIAIDEAPSLLWEIKNNDLGIVDLDVWKGKFRIIHNNEVKMKSYEGGDLRACENLLFVNPSVFIENEKSGISYDKTIDELERISGRTIAVVGKDYNPNLHLDMYFSPIEKRVVVMADLKPVLDALVKRGLATAGHHIAFERFQPYFDRISRVFRENGYDVRRAPMYFWQSPYIFERVQISMTNDIRDGNRIILGSSGMEEIDSQAKDVYGELGFKVVLLKFVDAANILNNVEKTNFNDSGARCIANVLSKS